jgi:hypothetical protein
LKVVNDGDMYLWRELGVNSWPTFVLIGPNGKVLAQISGEGHRKVLHISLENIIVVYTFLLLHPSILQTIFFGIHFFQESMRTILPLFISRLLFQRRSGVHDGREFRQDPVDGSLEVAVAAWQGETLSPLVERGSERRWELREDR